MVSVSLAQVSEFSFVLSSRARRIGIISREVGGDSGSGWSLGTRGQVFRNCWVVCLARRGSSSWSIRPGDRPDKNSLDS